MNFKKQYDDLIDIIEKNIKKDSTQIMKLIQEYFSFYSPDMITHSFEFITGMRLKEYIIKRRLISVVEEYKNGKKLEVLTELFGFPAVEYYRKSLKTHFGKTITEIEKEDYKHVAEALRLDRVLQFEEGELDLERKIFDMPETEFTRIKQLINLTEFYGLDSQQSEIAFQLSKNLDFPVADVVGFCADYFEHDYHINKRYRDVNVQNLAFLCLRLNKSVREGLEMMLDIDEDFTIADYRKIEDEVWQVLLDNSYGFDYEKFPSLVISIVEKMKKSNVSLDSIQEIMERLEWIEDVDEAIDFDWKDYQIDVDAYEQLQVMDQNQCEIEATYTNEFLGLPEDN